MTRYIHENFMLSCNEAEVLYHEYAKDLPIIDYHCHLSPDEIAGDHQFSTLAEIWLKGDHYKWRAMRTAGIDERYITGEASDWEKFQKFAEIIPETIGNPLYQWTHLELSDPFAINDRLLNSDSASYIYEHCNEVLKDPKYSSRGLLTHFNVEFVGTTDDPTDDLDAHKKIHEDSSFQTKVCPSFRPDRALHIDNPGTFRSCLSELEKVSEISIQSFEELVEALKSRALYFHQCGCRISDHGLSRLHPGKYDIAKADRALQVILGGGEVNEEGIRDFQMTLLIELGYVYHDLGWVQQYHLGPLRNVNTRMFKKLGADSGFDSITDGGHAEGLVCLFDNLEKEDSLSKTIIYNLNPAHNEVFAAFVGNYQKGPVRGKIQFGSGWWFNDQEDGILRQLKALSNLSLLSCFVGMLTDSRSFLSYSRHEYFRRILCDYLGREMKRGSIPGDENLIGMLVRKVCYENAKEYFTFPADK